MTRHRCLRPLILLYFCSFTSVVLCACVCVSAHPKSRMSAYVVFTCLIWPPGAQTGVSNPETDNVPGWIPHACVGIRLGSNNSRRPPQQLQPHYCKYNSPRRAGLSHLHFSAHLFLPSVASFCTLFFLPLAFDDFTRAPVQKHREDILWKNS